MVASKYPKIRLAFGAKNIPDFTLLDVTLPNLNPVPTTGRDMPHLNSSVCALTHEILELPAGARPGGRPE